MEQKKVVIPKVFHRVWIGNNPMPEEFVVYGESWQYYHPEWEMKLWTEKEIEEIKLQNQVLYDYAVNVVQKAEIARLEILYNYGGVYLDCDFECLRNIDDLISGLDAFSASEMEGVFSMGIMGCVSRNSVFKALIDGLEDSIKEYSSMPLNYQAGPMYATRIIKDYPYFKMFDAKLFYPYLWNEKHKKGKAFPSAYAVHHWANSANL